MAYTVLARKYRSKTFDDLVGQDAIATTLKNAVTAGRVHHGYLFTGTRGVGKTSTARVLAKALNCQAGDGPTPTPCCECESCRMVALGEDLDVIEIDAASNTGVDNIRDLRDNAAYRPARSRFKVYIIDEVHMLSTGAFNALLKTLEEPPEHVKFILATTEVQKVPATIVSRCQRFDFRSISVDEIAGHLQRILESEGIASDEKTLRRVARLANGSMRDGLSLLDQLLSFGAGKLTAKTLDEVLPSTHDEVVAALFDCVCGEDAAGALKCVERALSAGQTIERFCELAVEHVRSLMLLNVCGSDTDMVDVPSTVRGQLTQQAERFDAATFVYMISLLEEVRRAVKSSSASRALVDAAVVRLALASKFSDVAALIARLDGAGGEAAKDAAAKRTVTSPDATKREEPKAVAAEPRVSETPRRSSPAPSESAPQVRSAPSVGTPARTETPRRAASPASPVSSADEAKVRNDPAVRKALDLFEGTLVNVQKSDHKLFDNGSAGEQNGQQDEVSGNSGD